MLNSELPRTPSGFTLIGLAHPTEVTKSHIVGGVTTYLIREPASLLSASTHTFKWLEMSVITLKLFSSNLTVFNVYRPSSATKKPCKTAPFSYCLTDL